MFKKTKFRVLFIVLVMGMTVFGCKNTSSVDPVYNSFVINGTTYEFTLGNMKNFGDVFDTSANNVDLNLISNDTIKDLYFEFFVPIGNQKLVSGTYSFAYTCTQFTYSAGRIQTPEMNYDVTSGTIKISVSGSGNDAIYTIEFDCTIKDVLDLPAGTLKGTYRGTLDLL